MCRALDKKLDGVISKIIKLGDFKGKSDTCAILYGQGKIGAERVLLVGLGEKEKASLNTVRKAALVAANRAVDLKAGNIVLAVHQTLAGKRLRPVDMGRVLAEGAYCGGYRYDEFITSTENGRPKKLAVTIVDKNVNTAKKLSQGCRTGSIIGQSQSFARTLANRPASVLTPSVLAAAARKAASRTPQLSCTVFDDKQIRQKKMGGVIAVGQGSVNKPRFIVLKYTPRNARAKCPVVGFVGKAVTFDSGGISIKPSAGMQDMKLDMSGGAAVIGAMTAIAKLKPKVKVIGIVPSVENMPGGGSYRPGDIVTTFSKKTVEVQNTDAEGRMIMCDALHYAVQQKCDRIVDIATLTGACMVALGRYKAGLMANNEPMVKQLKAASEQSGESVWHMPVGDEYVEEMKSKIADLKNIGSKWGGACTAGAFLSQFVGDINWAHIDMAGVDLFDGGKDGITGSTGFGVRLLTTYVLNLDK